MDKITFRTIAIEVFSVVFAVLLALGLNNYWNERSNRNMGKAALQNIAGEIESNMHNLDSSLMELKVELDTLNRGKERMENGEKMNLTLGYTYPIMSDNAWTTANITQAVLYMDPEIIMDISDLYTMQEMFEDFGLSYFKLFPSLEFNRKDNERIILNSNIRQVQLSIQIGQQVLQGYEDFFREHKELLSRHHIEVPEISHE